MSSRKESDSPFHILLSLLFIGGAAWGVVAGKRMLTRQRENRRIPLNAEFLFYLFLDTKTCDGLVGDLEERYKLIFQNFGKGRADFWYWSMAIRSTGPIAWAWFKKLVMKPVLWVSSSLITHGLLKGLVAELVKRVRG
jgi:hypothetical protein